MLIYLFLSGIVTPNESIFSYYPGKSANDYTYPEFEPLFMDEVDPEVLANATTECGGASASQACIFDFIATGDKLLAEQSGQTDANSNQTSAVLGNWSFRTEILIRTTDVVKEYLCFQWISIKMQFSAVFADTLIVYNIDLYLI